MGFTYRETSGADLTYIRRLNYLTEVFGDESVTPESAEFLAGTEFYVGAWQPTDGVLVLDEDLDNPAGAAWFIFASSGAHGAGYVADDIPEVAVAVEKRYQGRGLGTQLLRRAADSVRARGCPGVSLCVHRDNPGARRLYEREGFTFHAAAGGAYDSLVLRFPAVG